MRFHAYFSETKEKSDRAFQDFISKLFQDSPELKSQCVDFEKRLINVSGYKIIFREWNVEKLNDLYLSDVTFTEDFEIKTQDIKFLITRFK